MRILVTGHTGFKGTWLTFLLNELGHEIHGLSLPNTPANSIYRLANAEKRLAGEYFCDLAEGLPQEFLDKVKPDRVIHFASQSLVSVGLSKPMETFRTNVTGTLNLLESVKICSSVHHLLVATSDKVYSRDQQRSRFQEIDKLGGEDPYSSSKAVQDFLVTQRVKGDPSWHLPTTVVRAGNVIGYGDFNVNRLLPDIVRAWRDSSVLMVRNPSHIRPWQHVLDCLGGYLVASEYCLENRIGFENLNFGPDESNISVLDIVKMAKTVLDFEFLDSSSNSNFAETPSLSISADKAKLSLGWSPKLSTTEAVRWTLEPLRDKDSNPYDVLTNQVLTYLELLPELANPGRN